MPTDDLRRQLDKAWKPPFFADYSEEAQVSRFAAAVAGPEPVHEVILDRLEAVARAHASERIESLVAHAPYCLYCGRHLGAGDRHRSECAIQEDA